MSPCPRCGSELSERRFGRETLDGCEECGGLWFDLQELQALTRDPATGLMEVERAFQPSVAGEQAGGEMKCPKCSAALYGFSFPHTPSVRLDACPNCRGIWVDDGELQAIAERMAAARPAAPAPIPLAEERKREQTRQACAFLFSTACPACRTTNSVSATTCFHCGQSLKSRSVFHLCPECDHPLEEITAHAAPIAVDACRLCDGVWFGEGELPAFLSLGASEIERLERIGGGGPRWPSERAARCPGCQHAMEREVLGTDSGVSIDLCPYCRGVWMQTAGLRRAYQYVANGGDLRLRQADAWGTG